MGGVDMIRGAMASTRSMAGAMASTRGGGTPWYRAGGAPLPIAVYEAKGAASLAASYVNVVNPGTFDAAPGVAPTWATGTGWTFNAASLQYLTTGIVPTADNWSYLVRFSGVTGNGVLVGCLNTNRLVYIQPLATAALVAYANSAAAIAVGPQLASGVLGMTGSVGYRNGVSEGSIGDWGAGTTLELYIGAMRRSASITNYLSGSIQYVIIWNTDTDHATWMPAVSAAVATL